MIILTIIQVSVETSKYTGFANIGYVVGYTGCLNYFQSMGSSCRSCGNKSYKKILRRIVVAQMPTVLSSSFS